MAGGAFKTGPGDLQSPAEVAFNAAQQVESLQQSHEDLRDIVYRHGEAISQHEGSFRGVFPAISAVQSSLGAWLTVVGIVAAILAGLGWFNLTRTASVGDRIGGLEVRTGAIEAKLTILPQQVADELRHQAPPAQPPKGH